jgi:hypothetical protein
LASPAAAESCPKNWAEFDKAVAASKAPAAKISEAKQLRASSESKHKAGNHKGAMEDIAKAKATIDLK